jgi:hypothetical protein
LPVVETAVKLKKCEHLQWHKTGVYAAECDGCGHELYFDRARDPFELEIPKEENVNLRKMFARKEPESTNLGAEPPAPWAGEDSTSTPLSERIGARLTNKKPDGVTENVTEGNSTPVMARSQTAKQSPAPRYSLNQERNWSMERWDEFMAELLANFKPEPKFLAKASKFYGIPVGMLKCRYLIYLKHQKQGYTSKPAKHIKKRKYTRGAAPAPSPSTSPTGELTSGRMAGPAFPIFSNDWDPAVQVKWLEVFEKVRG